MIVSVLYRHWDTPDNEGNEVMGVYFDNETAISKMKEDADRVKSYYPNDYWDKDMTWEDDTEIYLGRGSYTAYELSTNYYWTIAKMEVQ